MVPVFWEVGLTEGEEKSLIRQVRMAGRWCA